MKKIYFILALCISAKANSQNLTSFIPSTTPYVFGINLANIEAKSNQQDYAKYFEKMLKPRNYYYKQNEKTCALISLEEIIKNPSSFGIDNKTNVYLYTTERDQVSGKTYLFKLTDANLFESKITKECEDTLGIESKMTERGKVYVSDDMAICINGNIGTIFVKNYIYNYSGSYDKYNNYDQYDDENLAPAQVDTAMYYMDEEVIIEEPTGIEAPPTIQPMIDDSEETPEPAIIEEEYDIVESPAYDDNENYNDGNSKEREAFERKAQHELIFDFVYENITFQTLGIQENKGFQKLTAENHDAIVYLNTLGMFSKKSYNPFAFGMFIQEDAEIISDKNKLFTSDISAGYSIDFENGKAIVKMSNNFGENLYPYYKKIYAKKQSKNLYKYIEGKNLLGYVSVAIDVKESVKLYEDIVKEFTSNLKLKKKESYIYPAIELWYAFLDKDMLFGTFSGQAIYACTGFKDVNMKYTTYDYDEEYNMVSREVDTTQKQPKMVLLSGIENYDNAKKLFDIISKFEVFTKLSNNVISVGGNREIPFSMYIALTKDALIITNDGDLVLSNLNGLPKSEQISKEDKKNIGNHNVAMKIYAEKTLNGINESYFKNGQTLPMFSQMMMSLGDLEMHDEKLEKTSASTTAVLTLKDNSTNALYQLLKLMSELK